MNDLETLARNLRTALPGWRFVKELHLWKFRAERNDRGERLADSPDLPVWCDRETAEASGIFSREVLIGDESRLCFFPIPRTFQPSPEYYHHVGYSAQLIEAFGKCEPNVLAERWRQLDAEVRLDATFILLRDHRVPREAPTEAEFFAAFAVYFLAAWRFTPSFVQHLFPAVRDADVLARELLGELGGLAPIAHGRDLRVTEHPEWVEPIQSSSPERSKKLAALADKALRRGNAVRAAIACTEAVAATPSGSTKHRPAAESAIQQQLVPSLAKVFEWNAERESAWLKALIPVLNAAIGSGWPPAAKFLYDLQRLARDLGGELYIVDPAAWCFSLGKRPILRKLTLQRQTVLLVQLRRAFAHLNQAALREEDRNPIEALMQHEIDEAEGRLHRSLEPILNSALDRAGMVPGSLVEQLGRRKAIAEMLDRVCERGHIRLGDLRDALARNAFKLPDLAGPVELVQGDALLRADALLARELDGIYHRGEIYLRWFQRGSAAAFGTAAGRLLTKFALIPFIAAFMTVAFAQYLEHEGKAIARAVARLIQAHDPEVNYEIEINEAGEWDWIAEKVAHHAKAIEITDNSYWAIGVLAVVYLMMVNSLTFRDAVFRGLGHLGNGLRFLIFTLPSWVWHSAPVLALRRNAAVRFLVKRLLLPLAIALLVAAFVAAFGGSRTLVLRYFFGVFAGLAALLMTPFGQLLRDGTEEAASDAWRNFRYNLLPGLLSTIAWFFREVLGHFQNLLYTIDEWFRYREGQSKPNLVLKVILGIVWFPIAYVFRFAIFLLIEPQINPIKHFPTVTVSHKLLLPMIPAVAGATNLSIELVGTVFTGIPGIFGFLVWELKENWKLYKANRRKFLAPVILGHHGETMRGLLRPGFHSGTVPKDFRKIRNSTRHAEKVGTNAYAPKPLHELHSVEHAIQMFVERELVDFLFHMKCWANLFPTHSMVHLGVQSVRIEFGVSNLKGEAVIVFWHSEGEIRGRIAEKGFATLLDAEQREVWDRAIEGFFAKAAVGDGNLEWNSWQAFWQGSRR